jgi:hypothetical protein
MIFLILVAKYFLVKPRLGGCMKELTTFCAFFLLAISSTSNARTVREIGILDSLRNADSIFRLRVISGKDCTKNKECRTGDKIYSTKNDGAIYGKFVEVNQVIKHLNLCIGCTYYAIQKLRKDGKSNIEIFPVNVTVDPETSERRLLVLNSDFLIPLNQMKSKTLSRCEFLSVSSKCEEKIIYSYVTEDFFIRYLIKMRKESAP